MNTKQPDDLILTYGYTTGNTLSYFCTVTSTRMYYNRTASANSAVAKVTVDKADSAVTKAPA